MMQPHIKCDINDIAKNIFLPGDPNRIDKIIAHWASSKEVANNRGLRVVTGEYKGIPVSAVATGMGCPSAAIVIEELANLGVERIIRIGTCGALKGDINPGEAIIPYAAIRAEGTTKEYLPPEFPAVADPDVFRALKESAEELKVRYHTGVNRTHDSFYEPVENLAKWGNLMQDSRMKDWSYPLVSSEMECSVVFFLGMLRGIKAGTVLSVNTTEPLDKIRENPDIVYELIESPNAADGVDRAILIALGAMERLVVLDK